MKATNIRVAIENIEEAIKRLKAADVNPHVLELVKVKQGEELVICS